MSKQTVELFVADCPLCEGAAAKLRALACEECAVTIRDLATGCETDECVTDARSYGITSVPAVVVNGHLADCCASGGVTDDGLRALGIGAPA